MTVKRDFKRRVRQRQARTGESYVTARRHLLASRPSTEPSNDEDHDDDGGPRSSRISVVELIDVSDQARRVGLACRVLMFPSLIERIAPDRVLTRLHELLSATVDDPGTARLARLALGGTLPPASRAPAVHVDALRRFLRRARAGLGGTLDDATLAFHVSDGDGLVAILCALSSQGAGIELSMIDGLLPDPWAPLAPILALERRATPGLGEQLTSALRGLFRSMARAPLLRAVYRGRSYPMMRAPFVIGRSPLCDVVIDADGVADEHAAVILRGTAVYFKDLGGPDGVVYRGMRIDNKRIDEGDVFHICGHEIGFTFQAD